MKTDPSSHQYLFRRVCRFVHKDYVVRRRGVYVVRAMGATQMYVVRAMGATQMLTRQCNGEKWPK